LAFFCGVILNLMPCVFPVIGLKVLSFVEQSHHSRARLLALNAWYTLGVLGVFIGLALTAIVLRQFVGVDDFKFGSQNSVPGFVIGMAAVMFVMALSLLGVWEIPIPGFLGTGKASELSTREGAIGAVSKGAVTTLLGASCSGPLVAVPLGFALDRGTPAWATLGIFTLIGLGMAAPYMVIALNPRLLKMLPRPGAWMDTFKNIMGFVLLAAMVWVLTWLKLPLVAPTVAFLVGLWFACWWVGKMEITAPPGRRLRGWIVAVAVSVAAGFFAFSWLAPRILEKYDELLNREVAQRVSGGTPRNGPREKSDDPNRLPWSAFSRDVLEQLTRQRKTVMVDFTADWCPNCIALEEYVLNTAAIKRVVDQNGVVPLVADYTDTPPEITKMLSLLKAGAVPVLAIFPADRPNDPIVFRGGYTQSDLIEALEHAGPSIPAAPTSTTAMR
jgi:thiol:disulfide interchange protein